MTSEEIVKKQEAALARLEELEMSDILQLKAKLPNPNPHPHPHPHPNAITSTVAWWYVCRKKCGGGRPLRSCSTVSSSS